MLALAHMLLVKNKLISRFECLWSVYKAHEVYVYIFVTTRGLDTIIYLDK